VIGTRFRTDKGDIKGLAASIKKKSASVVVVTLPKWLAREKGLI
jgi:hypothetical protein